MVEKRQERKRSNSGSGGDFNVLSELCSGSFLGERQSPCSLSSAYASSEPPKFVRNSSRVYGPSDVHVKILEQVALLSNDQLPIGQTVADQAEIW